MLILTPTRLTLVVFLRVLCCNPLCRTNLLLTLALMAIIMMLASLWLVLNTNLFYVVVPVLPLIMAGRLAVVLMRVLTGRRL